MAHTNSLTAAMNEAASLYVSLWGQGVPLKTVDFGGGMPMDTSAAAPTSSASMHEYATAVISAFCRCCTEAGAPQPRLVCESGGAVAASSCALLVTACHTGVLHELFHTVHSSRCSDVLFFSLTILSPHKNQNTKTVYTV